jgi:hypothetical protein
MVTCRAPKVLCVTERERGIAVHDHLIVGRDGHASPKAMKLM